MWWNEAKNDIYTNIKSGETVGFSGDNNSMMNLRDEINTLLDDKECDKSEKNSDTESESKQMWFNMSIGGNFVHRIISHLI